MSSYLKRLKGKTRGALIASTSTPTAPAAPQSFQGAETPPRAPATAQGSQTVQTPAPASGNEYQDIVPEPEQTPQTPLEKARAAGSTTLHGLAVIAEGLKECSDLCLPLKAAAAGFWTIYKIFDGVSTNKEELTTLEKRSNAILLLVQRYKEEGGLKAIEGRVRSFSKAIERLVEVIQHSQDRPLATRIAEVSKDPGTIQRMLKDLNSVCDLFLIDIQLHTNVNVQNMLQLLNSRSIDKLRPEGASYKTRRSAYGDPTGCMPGTRVNVLKTLEDWAPDEQRPKVYWLVGMAGIGKSTIAQSFCELMEKRQMLGASFFCSRTSETTSDARHIIPGMAYQFSKGSPTITTGVVQALENEPDLAESNDLKEQFQALIRDPLQTAVKGQVGVYKIVVIDALDECRDLHIIHRLIKLILDSARSLPLKFLLVSRDDYLIKTAFKSSQDSHDIFLLHEIEKDVVERDIRIYLEVSLAEIKRDYDPGNDDEWPPDSELSQIVKDSGKLFIYASTARRYIRDGKVLYKEHLTFLAERAWSHQQTSTIDELYGGILKRVSDEQKERVLPRMKTLLSFIVFLRHPLSINALSALSNISEPKKYLLPLNSVIHIPTEENAPVTAFHASFPEFLTDPDRCPQNRFSQFAPLLPVDGHADLALKCLGLMNVSLKYNICDTPEELTVSHMDRTNPPENASKISEALKYACMHWAAHFSEIRDSGHQVFTPLIAALRDFLEAHLLHWMECLSVVSELRTGIYSLLSASTALSCVRTADTEYLQSLVDDACHFLRMSFECIQRNCFEVYRSAFTWIPKKSLMRQIYAAQVKQGPKVVLGLPDSWGSMELCIGGNSAVYSVAFSNEGSRVVSGSQDCAVRIWNARTGELEARFKGHTGSVTSVAFSHDNTRVVSGSDDRTMRIWNARTDELEAKFEGHAGSVTSVAFSHDDTRVVSGSSDRTVRVWNARTGKLEAKFEGHTDWVTSVAFSHDDTQVVSGSDDRTVRIWNVRTSELEAKFEGHTDSVTSAAFSHDNTRVVSGSDDQTVRIWDARTSKLEAKFKGHTDWVTSVAFSHDNKRVVSGSDDRTVRVWNVRTGELEAKFEGHTDSVTSVAFSHDDTRVVSGSNDRTVRVWNARASELEAKFEGHMGLVTSVAFSHDNTQVVSGSDDRTVRVWNVRTDELEAKFEGHTNWVTSVAFSYDDTRVVSGSNDRTVRVWNVRTDELEAKFEGHTDLVTSVAFSHDDTRVVSGSFDRTVRIWNVRAGELEAKFEGHMDWVRSIAFSHDDTQVVSVSDDRTVKIWCVRTGELEAKFEGHTDSVTSVAFSHDDTRVVSGSDDGTVRVWNASTDELEAKFEGHTASVTSVAFSHDNRQVIASQTGIVKTWNLAPNVALVPASGSSSAGSPLQPFISLSAGHHWVVNTHCHCWIPPPYRNARSCVFSANNACFGYGSGLVVILSIASVA